MGGVRVGILGTDAGARARSGGSRGILGGGDPPGVLGVGESITSDNRRRQTGRRIIAKATKAHTDHVAKTGVRHGDVNLDTSIK